MMQDYDFQEDLEGLSTNTSSKSVRHSQQPSRNVLQNIQIYARHASCIQYVTVNKVEIKICLN